MGVSSVLINSLGLSYGVLLIAVMWVRTPFTEAMRIDALLTREPTETTRPLNLIFGVLIAGYAVYSLSIRH